MCAIQAFPCNAIEFGAFGERFDFSFNFKMQIGRGFWLASFPAFSRRRTRILVIVTVSIPRFYFLRFFSFVLFFGFIFSKLSD